MGEDWGFSVDGERISKKKLERAWKDISKKPYPHGKILAIVIDEGEALRLFRLLNKEPRAKTATVEEYGGEKDSDLDLSDTHAFVTVTKRGFLVIIRKASPLSVDVNLKHELKHIADGEITLDKKVFGGQSWASR